MAKEKYPVTPAIRLLREKNINFTPYEYDYLKKGGTKQTASVLEVAEHNVIKTLVFETEQFPILILMHGDKEVANKELARQIGTKKCEPMKIEDAIKLTGYMFGGSSPFGTRKQIKLFIEESIISLPEIYINGGNRGFIIKINPIDIKLVCDYQTVNVAT